MYNEPFHVLQEALVVGIFFWIVSMFSFFFIHCSKIVTLQSNQKQTRRRRHDDRKMPPPRSCTHAQVDGQHKNIMPPAGGLIYWMGMEA